MKTKSVYKTICGLLCCCMLASLTMVNEAKADGTEQLGSPSIPSQRCTYTIGYWKNHPYDWPVDELSIYTGHEAMILLWTPPKKGNAYIILAHQYIAAELNVLNGASVPDEVLHAGRDAQEMLEQYKDEGTISKKSPDRGLAIDLARVLDDYNNGILGLGHCD